MGGIVPKVTKHEGHLVSFSLIVLISEVRSATLVASSSGLAEVVQGGLSCQCSNHLCKLHCYLSVVCVLRAGGVHSINLTL